MDYLYEMIIVVYGLNNRSERDMWWVDHSVSCVEEQPTANHRNIWDAYSTRIGDQLMRDYGGR